MVFPINLRWHLSRRKLCQIHPVRQRFHRHLEMLPIFRHQIRNRHLRRHGRILRVFQKTRHIRPQHRIQRPLNWLQHLQLARDIIRISVTSTHHRHLILPRIPKRRNRHHLCRLVMNHLRPEPLERLLQLRIRVHRNPQSVAIRQTRQIHPQNRLSLRHLINLIRIEREPNGPKIDRRHPSLPRPVRLPGKTRTQHHHLVPLLCQPLRQVVRKHRHPIRHRVIQVRGNRNSHVFMIQLSYEKVKDSRHRHRQSPRPL